MNFSDILLVIISSAGLLHGFAFAIYLGFLKKKKTTANYLLALILVFMAFRIGKSVMLNFGEDLEPIFIFAGLAFLLLIGPLVRWYVSGMTEVNFKLPKYYLLELAPFILLFISSFFVTKNWFETNSKGVIIVFSSVLIFIYLHFAFYILVANRLVQKVKKNHPKEQQTKSQKVIISWLRLLVIGLAIIWVSYFLNIIEDAVPYVVGPIMYSMVVYFLSFKAFQLKVTDIDGSVFKKNDDSQLFAQISKLVVEDKMFLEADISLSSLSKLIGKSTQKTSEVINQYAKQNFNDFINYHRIQESKRMLLGDAGKNYKISTIAFDSGFSSLSSFNSAFKKFEGTTPSSYSKR
ncbi:AraC family transcriptional regulator [Flagellimonas nanhaiensis]|uniref:AraC family transcriptional regulator n=1 Tax=Flagellimonas nanhaiensis TaxID=2292706 RepID=A0A371JUP5_9FLAO|nr:helix-turn-helix domain-containing protein [Allomuricauda nanhaiensis]RDY61538.1 AraC family transcriptional regulator [Allomuricauda nanhaiensis]